jgi:hypothetical protein
MSLLVYSPAGATVFAIKYLADRAAQVVFAEFCSFMLERTVRSLTDPDEGELRELVIADMAELPHATRRLDCSVEKGIAHGADRRYGKIAKLVDFEARLGPSYFH